ncbi:MAG: hypothetical protein VW495_13975 [Rhodobiaceae bacterium]
MAKFEIHSLDESRAEQAFALASLNFATQSVLHKTIAADLQEYRAYLRPTFLDDLGNGLSLMATDPNGDELMGILVVRDFCKQRFAGDLPYQEKYDQISALFEELEAIYMQARHLAAGDALLVDMAAVTSVHAGKGIYQALRKEISNRAKSLGYKYIIGELTSSATQKVVLEKMGHRKCAEIAFAEFTLQGTRPFASITDPKTVILAEETL